MFVELKSLLLKVFHSRVRILHKKNRMDRFALTFNNILFYNPHRGKFSKSLFTKQKALFVRKSLAWHQCGKSCWVYFLSPLLNFSLCPKHLTNFSPLKIFILREFQRSLWFKQKSIFAALMAALSDKFNLKTHTMGKSAPGKFRRAFAYYAAL